MRLICPLEWEIKSSSNGASQFAHRNVKEAIRLVVDSFDKNAFCFLADPEKAGRNLLDA